MKSPLLTITRILAGLVGAISIYWTISALIAFITAVINGNYLVGLFRASQSAAFGIFSVICMLYMRRGYIPFSRQQAVQGCLSFFVWGLLAFVIAGLVVDILNLDTGPEAALSLSLIFISAALGGGLGLYRFPPSSAPKPQTLDQIQPQQMTVDELPEKEPTQLRPEDHLHKFTNKEDIRPLILVGTVSSLMGYLLAHFLFSETLITWISRGDEEFVRSIIGDFVFQIICGLPFPSLVGFGIAAVTAAFFLKHPSPTRFILLFFVGFTIGFIAYFPYQFFMLIAAAF